MSLEQLLNDPQVQHFVNAEKQRQQFQGLVHGLNSQCWDICVEKPSTKLEGKTETCLVNCVQRFIDTTNFMINRLEKNTSLGGQENSEDLHL